MNIFAVIILSTILLEFILNLVSDLLNLRSLKPEVPQEFADIIDADRYRKSQEYTRVNTNFGFISSTFFLVVTLAFWFLGGFNLVDQWVRSLEYSPIISGILFIGILGIGNSILGLPFSIYHTFVIEERFGFNKTTVGTFIMDMVKGTALSVVIGVPLLAGVLYFFLETGELAWLYAWSATVVFTLLLQFIAPTWIMPLFNKFTPLPDGELKEEIMGYLGKVKFPVQGLFQMDGSKRSAKANAFFTGFGRNKRIALFDTLIEEQSVPELVAILAHEVGHYKKKHIITSMILSIFHMGILFYLMSHFLSSAGLFEAFYMQDISVYAGLLFFSMLYSPIELVLGIFLQIMSRKNEYQADRYAAETTGTGEHLITALKKLSVKNLSNLTPHPFTVFLHYSHPTVHQRVVALREIR
jgi:STE24 endopeptidase